MKKYLFLILISVPFALEAGVQKPKNAVAAAVFAFTLASCQQQPAHKPEQPHETKSYRSNFRYHFAESTGDQTVQMDLLYQTSSLFKRTPTDRLYAVHVDKSQVPDFDPKKHLLVIQNDPDALHFSAPNTTVDLVERITVETEEYGIKTQRQSYEYVKSVTIRYHAKVVVVAENNFDPNGLPSPEKKYKGTLTLTPSLPPLLPHQKYLWPQNTLSSEVRSGELASPQTLTFNLQVIQKKSQ